MLCIRPGGEELPGSFSCKAILPTSQRRSSKKGDAGRCHTCLMLVVKNKKGGNHEKNVINPVLNHAVDGGKWMREQAHAGC